MRVRKREKLQSHACENNGQRNFHIINYFLGRKFGDLSFSFRWWLGVPIPRRHQICYCVGQRGGILASFIALRAKRGCLLFQQTFSTQYLVRQVPSESFVCHRCINVTWEVLPNCGLMSSTHLVIKLHSIPLLVGSIFLRLLLQACGTIRRNRKQLWNWAYCPQFSSSTWTVVSLSFWCVKLERRIWYLTQRFKFNAWPGFLFAKTRGVSGSGQWTRREMDKLLLVCNCCRKSLQKKETKGRKDNQPVSWCCFGSYEVAMLLWENEGDTVGHGPQSEVEQAEMDCWWKQLYSRKNVSGLVRQALAILRSKWISRDSVPRKVRKNTVRSHATASKYLLLPHSWWLHLFWHEFLRQRPQSTSAPLWQLHW